VMAAALCTAAAARPGVWGPTRLLCAALLACGTLESGRLNGAREQRCTLPWRAPGVAVAVAADDGGGLGCQAGGCGCANHSAFLPSRVIAWCVVRGARLPSTRLDSAQTRTVDDAGLACSL
jgi:hypothetical protein